MVKIGHIGLGEFPLLLAPLEDISDQAFRKVIKPFGAIFMFTEFISSEGLINNELKSTRKLIISDEERPVSIQIFGHDIDSMIRATELAEKQSPT